MASNGSFSSQRGNYKYTTYWRVVENYSNNTATVYIKGTIQLVNNIEGSGSVGYPGGLYLYIPNGQYYEELQAGVINCRYVYIKSPKVEGENGYIEVKNDGTVTELPECSRVFNLSSDGTIENIQMGITWLGLYEGTEEDFDKYSRNANVVVNVKASNGHRNINGTWKDGYFWKKINGTWKRCLIWQKINGIWRKGK